MTVGIDLIEIARVRRALERYPSFRERCFTEAERAYCDSRPNPPQHDPGDGFFMRHLFAPFARTAFRRQYANVARMEDVLRDSGLDWTAVRPPKLTNKPLTGAYRTAIGRNIPGGWSISRADVAQCMLRVLEQRETIRQAVGLAH